MTTPNTTGPSAEIQRYTVAAFPCSHPECCGNVECKHFGDKDGFWVRHSDALAALSRAREEARREALEEAAKAVEDQWWLDEIGKAAVKIIRALLTPTPQGETKEQQP